MNKTYTVLLDEDMGLTYNFPVEAKMTWNQILDLIEKYRRLNWDCDLRSNEYGYDFHFIGRCGVELIPTIQPEKKRNFFQKLFHRG